MEASNVEWLATSVGRKRVALLIALVAITGCAAPIGVERIGALDAQREFSHHVLSTGELSGDAQILLRRANLYDAWDDDPRAALETLHTRLLPSSPSPTRRTQKTAATSSRPASTAGSTYFPPRGSRSPARSRAPFENAQTSTIAA